MAILGRAAASAIAPHVLALLAVVNVLMHQTIVKVLKSGLPEHYGNQDE